jgi:hypothetical protein
MKPWILMLFLIILHLGLIGQKTLMIEKIGTSRRFFLQEQDHVKMRFKNPDTLLAGKLWSIEEDQIVIQSMRSYPVALADITTVYRHFSFPVTVAGLAVTGGLMLFGIITINHLINNEQVFTNDMFVLTGSMLAIGGISFALSSKRYRIGDRWKVKILDYPVYD